MNAFSKKNKIALFMLPLLTHGGGAEAYFIDLARNLCERGFQADIITADEKLYSIFARWLHIFTRFNFFGKIDISGRESEKDISDRLGKARWMKLSYKDIKKRLGKYDIVYAKNEIVDLTLLKSLGYNQLPPIVVGVHTPLFYPDRKLFSSKIHNFIYTGFLYRWLLKGVKCIHVSNLATKEFVDKNFNVKSRLIYYPFSVDEVNSLAAKFKAKIVFEKEKFNIIFVGRLSEQKGVNVLINFIKQIAENRDLADHVCFNIFGSGEPKYKDELKSLSGKYPFVRYFGHVENKFMYDIMKQQDLMVAPSRWETLPYSILEAQAMGVPVVAFDIPGPCDIIINEKTGFLVKNEKELTRKIISMMEEKRNFSRADIAGNIEEKFNPTRIYFQLLGMFEENL